MSQSFTALESGIATAEAAPGLRGQHRDSTRSAKWMPVSIAIERTRIATVQLCIATA
jgi:hypothetical protein